MYVVMLECVNDVVQQQTSGEVEVLTVLCLEIFWL